MDDLAQAAAGEAMNAAAEGGTGLFQTSMTIRVKCYREDLMLKFANHFIEGGFVSQAPNRESNEQLSEIHTVYISKFFRKGLKGVLICQVESEKALPDDTFIVIGWTAPLTGSVQIYTVLVETGPGDFTWDQKSVKDLYDSFRGRFKTYTKEFKETWSLGNNTNIKLTTGLGGDREYNLKVTIHEDDSSDGDYLPIQITPKR
jgi:hypothetical protein